MKMKGGENVKFKHIFFLKKILKLYIYWFNVFALQRSFVKL
jgi:hypothetical protein